MSKRIDYRFLILALAWMAIIFWFSNQSSLFYLPEDWLDTIFKKSSHAAAYGILWLLWWLATGRRAWLALALTVGYAISDEWHQTFVPGRHGQWFDVGVDTLGALFMMFLAQSRWGRRLFDSFSSA
jgi:VanZ family protein